VDGLKAKLEGGKAFKENPGSSNRKSGDPGQKGCMLGEWEQEGMARP
jgi:hypothetical protein